MFYGPAQPDQPRLPRLTSLGFITAYGYPYSDVCSFFLMYNEIMEIHYGTKYQVPLEPLPSPLERGQWISLILWSGDPSNHTPADAGRNFAYRGVELSDNPFGA